MISTAQEKTAAQIFYGCGPLWAIPLNLGQTIFLRRRIVGQPGVQKTHLDHGKNPSYDLIEGFTLSGQHG
jgi:hypothetical protein